MRVYLHVALWCVLFAIFIALGIRTVGPAVIENKIGPIDPNHSTDSYLAGLARVQNGSELFLSLMDRLPRDKSLAIVVDSGNSPSEFLGMLVAYLAWPRDIQMVKVRPTTYASELAAIKGDSVSVVIFCDLKAPAWGPGATLFGPRISLVPIEYVNSNR